MCIKWTPNKWEKNNVEKVDPQKAEKNNGEKVDPQKVKPQKNMSIKKVPRPPAPAGDPGGAAPQQEGKKGVYIYYIYTYKTTL